jgi:hypothetical protein
MPALAPPSTRAQAACEGLADRDRGIAAALGAVVRRIRTMAPSGPSMCAPFTFVDAPPNWGVAAMRHQISFVS